MKRYNAYKIGIKFVFKWGLPVVFPAKYLASNSKKQIKNYVRAMIKKYDIFSSSHPFYRGEIVNIQTAIFYDGQQSGAWRALFI